MSANKPTAARPGLRSPPTLGSAEPTTSFAASTVTWCCFTSPSGSQELRSVCVRGLGELELRRSRLRWAAKEGAEAQVSLGARLPAPAPSWGPLLTHWQSTCSVLGGPTTPGPRFQRWACTRDRGTGPGSPLLSWDCWGQRVSGWWSERLENQRDLGHRVDSLPEHARDG